MKLFILLFGVLSVSMAREISEFIANHNEDEVIESEPKYQEIVPSQGMYSTNYLSMTPGERERLGMNFNQMEQRMQFDDMSISMPYQWMDTMGFYPDMNYQNMGMNMYQPNMGMNMYQPNMNMYQSNMNMPGYQNYPSFNQQMGRNSACGCQQICPPCLPWNPCMCQCPCSTTPTPDNNPAPESTTTTTTPSTTTTTTTTTTAPTTTTTVQQK